MHILYLWNVIVIHVEPKRVLEDLITNRTISCSIPSILFFFHNQIILILKSAASCSYIQLSV